MLCFISSDFVPVFLSDLESLNLPGPFFGHPHFIVVPFELQQCVIVREHTALTDPAHSDPKEN